MAPVACFLLLDADRFKTTNDECGHTAADKALVAVADTLSTSMRKSDIAYRLGGDELAAFAPQLMSEQTAKRTSEALQ